MNQQQSHNRPLLPRPKVGLGITLRRAAGMTALCSRIIPGLVLHEKQKGVFDVVEGEQRLICLLSYYADGAVRELFWMICSQLQCTPENMFATLGKVGREL